ncbi:MAG: thiamine ABC transporter substrate-binding protein [Anaerolineae bacterium]|nr:thiamine ABC transporter substrate-binding protein [Anaerolineae bacterium]
MKRWLILLIPVVLALAGCGAGTSEQMPAALSEPTSESPRELRVMAYSSFDISEAVIEAFESEHGAKLLFLDAGDTGQMVSQAILSKDNPQADVLYGVDNTFLSRALAGDIFEVYAAENLASVPDAYQLDPEHRVTPVDYGDVCLNYNRAYFADSGLAVPETLEDLTQPEYQGLLVVENPASSSPGLAFLLATIGSFGEDGYLGYWRALRANDVLVVDSWDTAYYGEFTPGNRPIVVSYATSPAAEVYYSETPPPPGLAAEPPTGAVVAPGTCFRQIEFVGILRNGRNRDLAEAFVDYVLSEPFQSDIPLHMWVFPANEDTVLPDVFEQYAVTADAPATVSADAIEQNREVWITDWTDVVLR